MLNLSIIVLFIVMTNSCVKQDSADTVKPGEPGHFTINEPWASSKDFQISINQTNGPGIRLTSGHRDFKPSWSNEGNMLTFFRLVDQNRAFHTWRTKICVINTDGSGFKELTAGDFPHFNPTWTRDGTNRIIFNRRSKDPALRNQIHLTSPNGSIGDEQLISHPSNTYYEWAFSGLKDGRIVIDRKGENLNKTFLLTPNPGGMGNYEEVSRPTDKIWHKLSVSPNETKVTYMLDNDGVLSTYQDVVIAIAEFDKKNLSIKNQRIITEFNDDYTVEYPRWTKDECCVVYDSNKTGNYQIYAYHLDKKSTVRISPDLDKDYRYANMEGLPK